MRRILSHILAKLNSTTTGSKPVGSLADWKSAKEPGYKPEATVKLKHSAKAEGMYPVVEKIIVPVDHQIPDGIFHFLCK